MRDQDQEMPAIPVSIESEMQNSYMDYAMSVIVGRALPDVRDGLKPVHRRVLYTMYEMGLDWNKSFRKSARVVGDVMGKYHPHGDSAIYDTLVRMAQDFSLRYPLVDGQGNFGSVDGDPAAAMRYTEARRTKISLEVLRDIEKNTVDFVPNYDDSLLEPEVLPAILPNLLLNGSSGIAVGMATNVPPQHLGEVVDGLVALLENPATSIDELCRYVKGPDFPTGAIIYGREGIYNAYRTGRGLIQVRARAFVEKEKRTERERIIITELPYQVNKARLIEKIADLVREKKIEGISDLRDESDRDGMRIVIELKRNEFVEVILNQLYKHTQLQVTFGAIMLALVDQKPKLLNLKEIMELFLKHRREVILRRTRFLLEKAEARDHIVQGLLIALDNIDAVVSLIRASQTPQVAREGLIQQFSLTEIQARAILDMRLQRLTGLEREKLEHEHQALLQEIEFLQSLLSEPALVTGLIKEELLGLKSAYGDERRTEIVDDTSEITLEDMIVEEDMMVMVTHAGYIKRNPVTLYRSQLRRGKGVTGIVAKENDFVELLFVASTHDYILVFTDKGKVYWLKVYIIPEAGRQAKGKAIVNLLQIEKDENVSAILPVQEFEAGKYIVMSTKKGVVKKTELTEYSHPRSNGIIALNITEGDELVSVALTDGEQDIFLSTHNGKAIRFSEKNVRAMGRTATGVRGISLSKNDYVTGMDIVRNEFTILTVTEKGYGKRSSVEQYRGQGRGGKGLINIKCTPKRGNVVGTLQVSDSDDILMITASGKIIRMGVASISVIGRNTQGVALQWLSDDDKVVAVARVLENDNAESEDDNVVAVTPPMLENDDTEHEDDNVVAVSHSVLENDNPESEDDNE
ncbi:MAG: DNA gyrase subunit A [bacterium]|nr:DNA gyrase subunit A [bacterium]